jgi:hypothetical protein
VYQGTFLSLPLPALCPTVSGTFADVMRKSMSWLLWCHVSLCSASHWCIYGTSHCRNGACGSHLSYGNLTFPHVCCWKISLCFWMSSGHVQTLSAGPKCVNPPEHDLSQCNPPLPPHASAHAIGNCILSLPLCSLKPLRTSDLRTV